MRSELFEETLKQHKDGLIDELEQLGKHRQAQLVAWDIEQNESDYEFYFNAAWQEQQAIINSLKVQLNNMEACYIEKKKQVEAVDAVLMNWRGGYTECTHQHECTVDAVLRTCITELEQALRGAND